MKKNQIDKVKNLDLATFDAKLRSMAESGAFDDAMEESLDRLLNQTDPIELTTGDLNKFYNAVNKASVEKQILEARNKTPITSLPLGRFLQLVRDRCGLTYAQVARALNKDASFVQRLENGQINPLNLKANEVADIMQLFRLTLTNIISTIEAYFSISLMQQNRISGMARSSIQADATDKGERLAHAMDALQAAVLKRKGNSHADTEKVDPSYLEGLRRELKKRDAKELLV
ncbi:MAG: helix-turn-helix domain-containing protein [Deltaproteobacteria bacterium]|nr:helix-turn-helix domain-containing protein [Deltaproteobacteria bacterium]